MGFKKIVEGAYLVPLGSANAVLLDQARARVQGAEGATSFGERGRIPGFESEQEEASTQR